MNKNTVENKTDTLWKGRFTEGLDEQALMFETSIHVDSRMAHDDINGSIAHVIMLGESGIITTEESATLCAELKKISGELQDGSLTINPHAEDIHSFIEGVLTDRLGNIGRKVHSGRSRNDQIALDEHLYLKRAIPQLQTELCTLITALVCIAEQHTETVLSGYTHMQRAQPVTLAHHLSAWCQMLVRDYHRLSDALKRANVCPLGAGALAASGLPLNRERVAALLDFPSITQNSLDTVADRDYFIELTACFALIMMHLSRFCEEVIIWSTEEFKFLSLSEKWSTGSSIMPQKKNPDFAELIRGRTGRVYGSLTALLTLMKSLPLSYNRDLQEDKESFFTAYDTVFSCIQIFTHMISTATWNTKEMAESCVGGYANATDLADYLVKKGLPFRTAHAAAAAAVRIGIEQKIKLEDLPLETLQNCSTLVEADIYEKLTPQACVYARNIPGGPNPEQVKNQIHILKDFIAKTFPK